MRKAVKVPVTDTEMFCSLAASCHIGMALTAGEQCWPRRVKRTSGEATGEVVVPWPRG